MVSAKKAALVALVSGIGFIGYNSIDGLTGRAYGEEARIQKNAETIETILKEIVYNQGLIKDVLVRYRHEIDLGFKPEIGSQKYREEIIGAWKGVKKYVAKNRWIEEQIEPAKTIMAFDGEKVTSLALTTYDTGTRVMNYEDAVGLTEALTPWWLGYAVWDTQWDKVIMNGTAKLVGTEMIGIHLCYIIQGKIDSDLPYKAWFDLERGFMPLRTQMFSPKGELCSTYETIELQKFGSDIWFPTKGNVRGSRGQVTTIFIDEVKINQGVPDSMFAPFASLR